MSSRYSVPTTAHGAFAHAAMHSSSTSVNSALDSPGRRPRAGEVEAGVDYFLNSYPR